MTLRFNLAAHSLRTCGTWAGALCIVLLAGCAQPEGPPPGLAMPAPDGTACYGQRQAFYAASNEAVAAEGRRQRLEGMSNLASSPAAQVLGDLLGSRVPGGSGVVGNLAGVLANLSRQANEDTGLINAFAGSFDALSRCRRDEVAGIRREVRARRASRADAAAQLAAIRQFAEMDAGIARDVNARLVSRTRQFQIAIEQVDTSIPADPAMRRQRAETEGVRRTVQTNQRALVTQAAAVEASVSPRAFEISALHPPAAARLG